MINTKRSLLLGLNILGLVILATTTINNSQFQFANPNSMIVYAQEIMEFPSAGFGMESQPSQQPGEYSTGTIANIQKDKDDISTWLLSGVWKGAN